MVYGNSLTQRLLDWSIVFKTEGRHNTSLEEYEYMK